MGDVEGGYNWVRLDGEDSKLINSRRWLKTMIVLIGASCLVLLSTIVAAASKVSSVAAKTDTGELASDVNLAFIEEIDEAEEEQIKVKRKKERALLEKERGNTAYKKKDFDEAIRCYRAAIAIDDTDISFLLNLAAVYFEQGEWDECIKHCEEAIEKGNKSKTIKFGGFLKSDSQTQTQKIAKAMTRKGNALVKKGELESAVKILKESLLEHRTDDTLTKLKEVEQALEKKKKAHEWQDAYLQ